MSYDACAERVRAAAADLFACALLAPADKRGPLLALYAFDLELARAEKVSREPLVVAMRLQFWRDALDEIYAGRKPPGHELAEPLAEAVRVCSLPKAMLSALIDAHAEGQQNAVVTIARMQAAARLLGADGASLAVITDIAFAAGIAAALSENPVLPETIRDAITRLASARKRRALVPKAALAALLPGRNAGTQLRKALKSPGKPVSVSEFRRRWSLLWRASTGLW